MLAEGRILLVVTGLLVAALLSAAAPRAGAGIRSPASAQPRQDVHITPQFFGQHLMFLDSRPLIPVHAMRLWDSNTKWCQMDRGTASDRYDFRSLDARLAQASRLGAQVEFTFGGTPQWAVSGAYPQPSAVGQCSTSSSSPPADEAYWTDFVTALVAHARGRIHAYELWNEADFSAFWSGDVAQMVRMTVDAAAIIHRRDPSAVVLSPSVINTDGGRSFLNQYLSRLPSGTVDAIAVHNYTRGAWPEDAVPAAMNALRSALPRAYADTPIWSTEGGWGLNSSFSTNVSDQRAFVARYDLQMIAQGLASSYWYAYPNSQWGTLSNGAALTPAGIATRTLEGWLVGATLAGCTTGDGNLWSCDLTTGAGRDARIVWATRTAVPDYPTAGFGSMQTLDGGTFPTGGSTMTVRGEPVLLSSETPPPGTALGPRERSVPLLGPVLESSASGR